MPLRTITTQKNITSLGRLTHIKEGNNKYDGKRQEWTKEKTHIQRSISKCKRKH